MKNATPDSSRILQSTGHWFSVGNGGEHQCVRFTCHSGALCTFNQLPQQREPAVVEPVEVQISAAILLSGPYSRILAIGLYRSLNFI